MQRIDPREFDERLEQVLATLWNAAQDGDRRAWRSGVDISRALLEGSGISMHWRTIDSILRRHGTLVKRRKRHRRWEYILLAEGEELVGRAQGSISLVDPDQSLQATIRLHELLGKLVGTVRVCDPYTDAVTLEQLDACDSSLDVKLLTQTVRDSGKLRRLVGAARRDFARFEIRTAPQKNLHDRYVIDDDSMIILGSSLNGFGKKQSFIIRVGTDFRTGMLLQFEQLWSAGKTWP